MLNTIHQYNPLSSEWEKRYEAQPPEIRAKLDNVDCQLTVIKKTRKPSINVGDIFVLSPRAGVYFYGNVLKTNIRTINGESFFDGNSTVFIFKCRTHEPTIRNYHPNYNELLISPSIVHMSYWQKGLFLTIGNRPLSEIEKTLDYGFYEMGNGYQDDWYCTEEGVKISNTPKIIGMYAISTITDIATRIEKELIMDPTLLGDSVDLNEDRNDLQVDKLKTDEKKDEDDSFEKEIAPFFWNESDDGASVCLDVGEYKDDIFKERADEGFEGNGYDWESLAQVFLSEKAPEIADAIDFDSEAGMFCAYSADTEALQKFITAFKEICENDDEIRDLFSRAILD